MPNADSHQSRVLQEDNTELAYEFARKFPVSRLCQPITFCRRASTLSNHPFGLKLACSLPCCLGFGFGLGSLTSLVASHAPFRCCLTHLLVPIPATPLLLRFAHALPYARRKALLLLCTCFPTSPALTHLLQRSWILGRVEPSSRNDVIAILDSVMHLDQLLLHCIQLFLWPFPQDLHNHCIPSILPNRIVEAWAIAFTIPVLAHALCPPARLANVCFPRRTSNLVDEWPPLVPMQGYTAENLDTKGIHEVSNPSNSCLTRPELTRFPFVPRWRRAASALLQPIIRLLGEPVLLEPLPCPFCSRCALPVTAPSPRTRRSCRWEARFARALARILATSADTAPCSPVPEISMMPEGLARRRAAP